MPLTDDDLEALAKAVAAELLPLRERIEKLERRPGLKYCGVWSAGLFSEGDVVTSDGSMWVCRHATREKPGASTSWTLAVKRGRDAR